MTKSQENFVSKEEVVLDQYLRPKAWGEFIGQEPVKRALQILISSAKKRKSVCDHILFYGPAGLGKTTLAYLIAKELSSKITVTSGPAIKKAGDLAAILTNLENGEILFIDEAHRLNKQVEEILYPAMESSTLHLVIGKGVSARSLELKLPRFTLIAATTRPSLLSNPLRSRFGAFGHLDFYEEHEISSILKHSAGVLEIAIDEAALELLAKASRATPRVANRLLKRVWDLAVVRNKKMIDARLVTEALEILGIDELGLERLDLQFLDLVARKFSGGPVGVKTLAVALNEEPQTLEELCEPYLIRLGFLERTSKGRVLTLPAQHYLRAKKLN